MLPHLQPNLTFDLSSDDLEPSDYKPIDTKWSIHANRALIAKDRKCPSTHTSNGNRLLANLTRFKDKAPVWILLESLLWDKCCYQEADHQKRLRLFRRVCGCLSQYNFIGETFDNEALHPQRIHFNKMLNLLFTELSAKPDNDIRLKIPNTGHYVPKISTHHHRIFSNHNKNHLLQPSKYTKEFIDLGIIEEGGFGVVCKAKHRFDSRLYAVKMIPFRFKRGCDILERITREVHLNSSLPSHPNLVNYKTAWLEHFISNSADTLRKSSSNSSSSSSKSSSDPSSSKEQSLKNNSDDNDLLSIHFSNTSASPRNIYTVKVMEVKDEKELSTLKMSPELSSPFREATIIKNNNSKLNNSSREGLNFDFIETKSIDSKSENNESRQSFNGQNRNQKTSKVQTSNKIIPKASLKFGAILYIQMELCGKNLKLWLKERNDRIAISKPQQFHSMATDPLSMVNYQECLKIFRQITKGVEFIHSKQLIHRDLKPQNILFSLDNSQVKIGDFGLATLHEKEMIPLAPNGSTKKNEKKTEADHTQGVGTSIYASPEQKILSNYDHKSDIYSLGIVLFELFYPFTTDMEKVECINRIRASKKLPTSIETKWPVLNHLVIQMANESPKQRPDASEILRSDLFMSKSQEQIQSLETRLENMGLELELKSKENKCLKDLLIKKDAEIEMLKALLAMKSN